MSNQPLQKTADYLNSALDLEDQMGGEVYGQYLKKEAWPKQLDEAGFLELKQLLDILIEETEEHKREFLTMKNRFSV